MAETSEKKRLVALLLCFFLGGLGAHRFYVGKTGSGIAQILTLGGLGIWILIDFIMIICGNFADKDGSPLTEW
jgi:TM2 domain-containing membrane protein YozV